MAYEKQTCTKCQGSGVWGRYTAEPETCPACDGRGYKEVWVDSSSSSSGSSYSSSSRSSTPTEESDSEDMVNRLFKRFERAKELDNIGSACLSSQDNQGKASAFGELVDIITDPAWADNVKEIQKHTSSNLVNIKAFEDSLKLYCAHAYTGYSSCARYKDNKGDFNGAINDQYLCIKYDTILQHLQNKIDEEFLSTAVLGGIFLNRGNMYKNKGDISKANADFQRAVNFADPSNQKYLDYLKGQGIIQIQTTESLNNNAQAEYNAGHYTVAEFLWKKAGNTNALNQLKKESIKHTYSKHAPLSSSSSSTPSSTPQQQSSSSSSSSTQTTQSRSGKKSHLLRNIIIAAVIAVVLYNVAPYVTRIFNKEPASASRTATNTLQDIVSSSAGWVAFVDGGNSIVKNNTTANITFGKETMQNTETDVMTLQVNLASGTEWRIGEFTLSNDTFLRQIKSANGIRFSVLGDGEGGWRVMFPMRETQSDNCFHEKGFSTTNGQVTQVDIPFSSLAQPSWGRRVVFNKRNILSIIIQRNATDSNYSGSPDSNYSGSSTIKVFGFEVY